MLEYQDRLNSRRLRTMGAPLYPTIWAEDRVTHLRQRVLVAAAAVAACITGWPASPAGAATATATITGGSLAFVSPPPDVAFSATLNGANQAVTASQALDVSDATGSGAGWSITATSTTFTTGGGSPVTLATNSTSVASTPTTACDGGSSCVVATNNVSYPYSLPAGGTAPSATKVFNAALNTGTGNETVTVTWSLAVPSSATPGTYTSTWTLSLVSGP